ncbi:MULTISPECIES: hypothetical protein [Paenibacillus]|uniref:hypothetical protein n=1 Tax=Paenibacillus TaxID=44249 RepID=UPI00142E5EBA|nr:hypothetical protein [Paenibacillus rhizosphaerae]
MATRVSHPVEVKKKATKMRLDGIPVKEVMDQLNPSYRGARFCAKSKLFILQEF